MNSKLVTCFASIVTAFNLSIAVTQKSIMSKYCSAPPYVEIASKPNVILVMDYSGSMQLPAHFGCKWGSSKRVAECNDGKWIKKTYDKNKVYYGYFNPDLYYKYNSSGGYWEVNTGCSPTGDMVRIGSGSDCISGNLLNWISMSRYDVALKALTGGKLRGCSGNKDSEKCLIPKGAYRKVEEENLNCKFKVEPNTYWNNQAQFNKPKYDLKISVLDYKGDCKIGSFNNRWLRIKIDPSTKTGILHKNADIADYALFVYSSSNIYEFNRQGEIRFSLGDYRSYANPSDAMNALVKKLENEMPWGGTPTGPALCEVIDYLAQNDKANGDNCYINYENTSPYIGKKSIKDPFAEPIVEGDWENKLKITPCKQTAVVLISDGYWNEGNDPDSIARYMHTKDLRPDIDGKQVADIFTLFAFSGNNNEGRNSMQTVAASGSFIDIDGDGKPFDIPIDSLSSRKIEFPTNRCNPSQPEDYCKEWDKDKNGIPDNYYEAKNGDEFEKALTDILATIVKYSYSGGSIGLLAEKSKFNQNVSLYRGLVVGQALFYTEWSGISWLGKLLGYWLLLDDFTFREDTDKDKILNKYNDNIIELGLDSDNNLKIKIKSASGTQETTDPDDISLLFEAGNILHKTPHSERKIYVPDPECLNSSCLKEFKYTNTEDYIYTEGGLNLPLLGVPDRACYPTNQNAICSVWENAHSAIDMFNSFYTCLQENDDYVNIIEYVRGKDKVGYRDRTINSSEWKLGDIMYSTPVFVQYTNTSVIYVGSNDGMLHAFEVGSLTTEGINLAEGDIVRLKSNSKIGKELWAFIPQNILPYLRFLTDPLYCHLYMVDLTSYIYKDKDTNKLYLIGGYRLGGATGGNSDNDVKPPFWSCPKFNISDLEKYCLEQCNIQDANQCAKLRELENSPCLGLSGYFAIDITDPYNPKFLWEFTHPKLGFAYSGPAIIRKRENTYVLFASGPTNYYGDASQNLTLFIIDLYTGDVVRLIDKFTSGQDVYGQGSSIYNAFGGRLFTEGIDYDLDGYTDYIAFGYSKYNPSGNAWGGGLIFGDVRSQEPNEWNFTKYLESEKVPITAKVEHMRCFDSYYLFFGSGKWFHKLDDKIDAERNYIYGVRLECNDTGCKPNVEFANNSSEACSLKSPSSWKIALDKAVGDYQKEKVITDPTSVPVGNYVLFTSTQPLNDSCKFGGRTRVWALNCATGGALSEVCSVFPIKHPTGKLVLPMSGGNVERIDINEIYSKGNKTSNWFEGTPPEAAPPVINKRGKILLWIEK